jgi:hypothetical protein
MSRGKPLRLLEGSPLQALKGGCWDILGAWFYEHSYPSVLSLCYSKLPPKKLLNRLPSGVAILCLEPPTCSCLVSSRTLTSLLMAVKKALPSNIWLHYVKSRSRARAVSARSSAFHQLCLSEHTVSLTCSPIF